MNIQLPLSLDLIEVHLWSKRLSAAAVPLETSPVREPHTGTALSVPAHLSKADLLRVTFFGRLDAWMQSAVLLDSINVRVSREHPWEQRSNVQFHEDLGPSCVLSLSVSSSLPLL